jgi:hypothetical protein
MQSCKSSKTVLLWPGNLSISRILFIGSLALLTQFTRVEAAPLTAFPCTLAWNQCQDSTVSGYCLYYGITSSTTTNRLDVGMTSLVTLNNLLASSNYFFYVTAYDSIGTEGPPSDAMCYTPPALSALKLTQLVNRTMNLHFLAAPGTVCRVLYSSTLNPPQWQFLVGAIADANGNVTITDPLSGNPPARYYRSVLLYQPGLP